MRQEIVTSPRSFGTKDLDCRKPGFPNATTNGKVIGVRNSVIANADSLLRANCHTENVFPAPIQLTRAHSHQFKCYPSSSNFFLCSLAMALLSHQLFSNFCSFGNKTGLIRYAVVSCDHFQGRLERRKGIAFLRQQNHSRHSPARQFS